MHSATFLKTLAAGAIFATGLAGATGSASAADVVKRPAPVVVAAPTHTWDLLFGVTATSQYISRGLAQSSGAAIQPWAELDVNSFYLGYWGSNVSPSLISGAHFENDLSIGWRPTHGPLTFDVGYVRYVYDVSSIDYGEVYGKVSVNPVAPLTLGAAIFYSPDLATTYIEGNAKVALHSGFSVSGAIGSQDGTLSWNAGASWQPHDWLTFDGRYYAGPSDGGANKFVVSVAFATSLKKLGGGKY
jgi:uncharacterized protein (TIGR02001 family)